MSLAADRFPTWFEAVRGFPPYDWQTRLVTQVAETGRWPTLLDLPTGSGKTSAIDIGLFLTALDPGRHPRRVVYVVDRRIIVEQTAEYVRTIQERHDDRAQGIVAEVRDALRSVGGDHRGPPIRFAELRGGIARDEEWAMRPDVPAVLVSTVDQVGSRVLFRGYGISPKMRPIHAGLLGNDCLYLLDEVHLSRPFSETLRALQDRGSEAGSLPRRWHVVEMSATPGPEPDHVFALTSADVSPPSHTVLSRRVGAVKETTLRQFGKPTATPEDVITASVPAIAHSVPGNAIGVVVNRVATARRVAQALAKDPEIGPDRVHLLTGRMRPWEREKEWDRIRNHFGADRAHADDVPRRYLVATQTIEAGADLDLDGMVTEIASLDALRQRFGRVDRRGRCHAHGTPAHIVVMAAAAQTKASYEDFVYGSALSVTWAALSNRHGDGVFDSGPLSEDVRFGADEPPLHAPTGSAPLLLSHHRELLVQTLPEPSTSPDVSYWLHGAQRVSPEVNVVWRADLTPWHLSDPRHALALLAPCPPHRSEALSIPFGAVVRWLRARAETAIADVEGKAEEADPDTRSLDVGRVVRWLGADTQCIGVSEIRPGDTIVVPSGVGGLSQGVWDPTSSTAVVDIGDQPLDPMPSPVNRGPSSKRRSIRLTQPVVAQYVDDPSDLPGPPGDHDVVGDHPGPAVALAQWLDALDEDRIKSPAWVRSVRTLLPSAVWLEVPMAEQTLAYVLSEPQASRNVASEADGSDETQSFVGERVRLRDHCDEVGRRAGVYAAACGLPTELVADLTLAGRLHDLGKADPRFQIWLNEGDPVRAAMQPEPLAKSTGDPRDHRGRRQQRERSGYPAGYRHEILSAALVLSEPAVLELARDADLVTHLVATHHGWGRAVPPPQPDPDPLDVAVEFDGMRLACSTDHGLTRLGSGLTRRTRKLMDHYGWLGLAWLEAILRLADQRVSAGEESPNT